MSKVRWLRENFTAISDKGIANWNNGANINTVKTGTLEVKTLGSNAHKIITDMINNKIMEAKSEMLLKSIYPVGSVMIRYDTINPSTLLGLTGTKWERIASDKYIKSGTEAGSLGGSTISGATTLTANQVPNHNHTWSGTTSTIGAHQHEIRNQDRIGTGKKTWLAGLGCTTQDAAYRSGVGMHWWNANYDTIGQIMEFVAQNGGSHSHSVSGITSSFGTSGEHTHPNITPPYITLVFWRRTA
jgi:hypothetical protein